ncbi:iron-sulfur cluster assembly scaffold protein [Rhizobium mayense]|uniref:Iron-sulfur cluster assembly scaffold protein n=1 Tax=Rhizobium mayense TaxID=1312184 RepID=A0ABT7K5K9_9HYPH|nr:iron-sulfur cluster assembly scaffold protein [Rhizobium mayense]MDL2402424.1 iron-sulfur cluster assembly scaffold protein [Rhizobium mayense]
MRNNRDKLKKSSCDHKGARVLQTANPESNGGAVVCGNALGLVMRFDQPMEAITAAKLQALCSRFAIACSSDLIEFIIGKTALRIINYDLADFLDRPPFAGSPSSTGSFAMRSRTSRPGASKLPKKRLLRSLRRWSSKASLRQKRAGRQAQRKAPYSRARKHLCNRRSFAVESRRGRGAHDGAHLKHSERHLKLPNDVAATSSGNRTLPLSFSPDGKMKTT